MRSKDFILALCVVIIWGVNFVVIKVGLDDIPPFLLASLRFALVAFPACLFIRRPAVPFKWLLAYGLTISFGQFAFLFLSIKLGMPAGLASLILQAQVFFTLLFGALFLRESLRWYNIAGLLIAVCGMIFLAEHSLTGTGTVGMPLIALLFTLAAAVCWGLGNITNKVIMRHYPVPAMSLVVWSAFIPLLPFMLCSWWFDGIDTIQYSLTHFSFTGVFAVIYLSLLSTIIGYGLWGSLLARYETSRVAPMALLVPVAGIFSAALLLHESMSPAQISGIMVIIAGLLVNTFAGKLQQRLTGNLTNNR
ncbi:MULTISPECIES: EamA family transporter [Tatumella]|uniref:EamA family transporter n=1 Tax=Tatumella punctata TaxID=399969 RepID=A0ABW1VNW3_9GAMM|nr:MULTISPECIES: EamA family transporter [unclassified Tatumella]MBS0855631.1 EamA family transporter [Tatumella sp. JGM16]MBS0876612.1 EamA family transporter [Tatumella sp. JGM82]MBS0890001.1 EamA family transporter [Tatumella sp. JGM94]MBS0893136.1 EamA family transporter [Tatumella sp. JGM130]MBS0901245.1 EamA family transporter [Tatumella sp. JGM100]